MDQFQVQKGVRIMYSEEEKIRWLERLLSSGLTCSAASKRPGWPGYSTLSKWIGQLKRGEIAVSIPTPKGFAGNRPKNAWYPLETKVEAVKLYEQGRRPSEIGRLLGIDSVSCIRTWWKQAMLSGKLWGKPTKPKPLADSGEDAMPKRKVPPEVAALSEAELENACLRAVLADLKAEGWDPASISNRKKAELGERLRRETGRALHEIIRFLGISKSSYEYHRARLGRARRDEGGLRRRVSEIFADSRGSYGYRRVHAALRLEGTRVSEKVVRRIMREGGMVASTVPKRRRWSSYAGEVGEAPPNLVKRDFHATAPGRLLLTDITQFSLRTFKCYLSAIVDCFDGKVAAFEVSLCPDARLANMTLDKALRSGAAPSGAIIHSDRGAHYRWPGWVRRCAENGIVRSMSAKGCTPDNAACEGFFGRMKNEFFYGKEWASTSYEEFKRALADYIDWYNEERIKESLGWKSPNQYRRDLGLAA